MFLSWYSVEGLTYRVQSKTNWNETVWTDVPGDVTATDAISWKAWPAPPTTQCFYRVIVR